MDDIEADPFITIALELADVARVEGGRLGTGIDAGRECQLKVFNPDVLTAADQLLALR